MRFIAEKSVRLKAVDSTAVCPDENRDFHLYQVVYRSHLASPLHCKQKAAIPTLSQARSSAF
jgi:hypothetical protein